MDNFVTHFQTYRDENDLNSDPMQDRFADVLSNLAQKLSRPQTKSWFRSKPKAIQSLYVWGGVGRGKTMMMDLFFDFVPIEDKRRVHFNIFMLDVHNTITLLRQDGKGRDPLPQIAKDIAKHCRLLCFDEFQVYDIADAMVLAGLFTALFDEGVTVIATSNVAPDNLYKNGLQRSRFLPFIDIVKKRMQVFHMDSDTDYRQQALREDGVYFVGAIEPMEHLFEKMVGAMTPSSYTLKVNDRTLPIEREANGCAWLSFQELCEKPRAAGDYHALAQAFETIFIYNVQRMGYDRRNEMKRFILLIDTLYDADRRVVIHAEDIPQHLCVGGEHAFEFERTVSRLLEMQGEEYLRKTSDVKADIN